MPWRRKPTKGAASRDSPRGGANGLRSGGARMGEPAAGHAAAPQDEYIVLEEATRGTETSKYPEEEKSTEIPRVAASESGRCPNRRLRHRLEPLDLRCCGGRRPGAPGPGRGDKSGGQPNGLGRPAAQGESPVREACALRGGHPSNAGHVKPGMKQGGPPSKAEHSPVTDSERVP